MNEQRFWEIIETAWESLPLLNELRQEAMQTNEPSLFEGLSFGLNDEVTEEIEKHLENLSEQELTGFNRIMEEKLYTIDREDIHKYTDGSDDGFLYCRGFIVGMGGQYYNAVNDNPATATMDAEAESVCFVGYEVYKKKFNKEFKRYSTYNIESCSNAKGWPSD